MRLYLSKSHVKGHYATRNGKRFWVKDYDDKRTKTPAMSSADGGTLSLFDEPVPKRKTRDAETPKKTYKVGDMIEKTPGDDGLEVHITQGAKGYHVTLWDIDADEPYTTTIYPTLERARAKAPEIKIPDVLYHGTSAVFDTFEGNQSNGWSVSRKGHYFTDDIDAAKEFGHVVIPAKVTMNNPLDLREDTSEVNRIVESLASKEDVDAITEQIGRFTAYRFVTQGLAQTSEFISAAKSRGYDGLIMPDNLGGTMGQYFDSYIVFDPQQIERLDTKKLSALDGDRPDKAYNAQIWRNFKHMNTEPDEWHSIDDLYGQSTADFHHANSLYAGDDVCELCGKTGLKDKYDIANPTQKLFMQVGSECVKHCGRGVTGKQAVKESKARAAAKTAESMIDLPKLASDLVDAYGIDVGGVKKLPAFHPVSALALKLRSIDPKKKTAAAEAKALVAESVKLLEKANYPAAADWADHDLAKSNYNPDEPRDEKGRWTAEQMNARAARKSGITSRPESIAYIRRDGKGIDGSAMRMGSGSTQRIIDHREIAQHALNEETTDSQSADMVRFMSETGNIRVVGNREDLNIDVPIKQGMHSTQQINALRRLVGNKTVYYDFTDGTGSVVDSGEGNFGNFVRDMKRVIAEEKDFSESKEKSKIHKRLQPMADVILKHNLSKEEFHNARYNREHPLYPEIDRAMDAAGFGKNKIWDDYGFQYGQNQFYDAVAEEYNLQKSESSYRLHYQTHFQGIKVSVENRRGSVRRGQDRDGHKWETHMHYAYGRIPYTEGTDGEAVDVYLGPNKKSEQVFVVQQVRPDTGAFDENKVMLGFNSAAEAKAAYLKQYDNPKFFGSMTEMTIDDFKTKLKERKGKVIKSYITYDELEKFGIEWVCKQAKKLGVDWKTSPFGPQELYEGMQLEREHTGGKLEVAHNLEDVLKIAMTHLQESPIYYKKLAKMEESFDKKGKIKKSVRLILRGGSR